ncbi:MAG: hypothetical protein H6624_11405 [Bdellovibrionaceae bacterium]|nr:hypothetical protein [Pseudobdellovibrionaceae bacterium]
MIPTAPQQWETEYRAHCYVSFPRVDYIKLTAINKGTNGDADQPSVPSSQQASQIYSSTGDAQRSLSKTEGLFPVDLDLTGLFQSTETSNTYKNRGGRFVPRYSFTAEYNEDKVTWDSVRVFVGNESHDLLEFDLPLREDHATNTGNAKKKDVLYSELLASGGIEDHIEGMMTTISQKYNWANHNSRKISDLKFAYTFVGTETETGLKVTSGEPLERTFKTSFNLRRKDNQPHNYVAGGCTRDYSTSMSSYVSSEMAEVVHYLTNVMGVRTLCNDGSLPFGGRFSVNYQEEALNTTHMSHKDGEHMDLRYFSDQDCSAFAVGSGDQIPFEFQAVVVSQPSIPDEQSACEVKGSFENYYDHPNATRRIKDWDHSKEFLLALEGLSETARQACLATSSVCPELIAQSVTSVSVPDYNLELEKNRRIAARNLRAIIRLSRWTVYNRHKWTDLTQRFPRAFIYFSPGPKKPPPQPNLPPPVAPARERWQQRIMLSGTIEQKEMLAESLGGALVPIGKCVDDFSTPDVECDLTPFPDSGVGNQPIKFKTKMIKGHYHHIHIGLVPNAQ